MLTTQQFQTLDDLYAFYNVRLFGASLPECIVNLSRKANSYGFFAFDVWVSQTEKQTTCHEISLNPDYMFRPSIEWHATLIHEMVHLWQFEYGTPSRQAYHNAEWGRKILSLGFMPSSTGKPGGAKTGQTMSQYIIPGGQFYTVFHSLDATELDALRLRYLPAVSLFANTNNKPDDGDGEEQNDTGTRTKKKSGIRFKYTCPCGNHVWGRSSLHIHCLECDADFTESC